MVGNRKEGRRERMMGMLYVARLVEYGYVFIQMEEWIGVHDRVARKRTRISRDLTAKLMMMIVVVTYLCILLLPIFFFLFSFFVI